MCLVTFVETQNKFLIEQLDGNIVHVLENTSIIDFEAKVNYGEKIPWMGSF